MIPLVEQAASLFRRTRKARIEQDGSLFYVVGTRKVPFAFAHGTFF